MQWHRAAAVLWRRSLDGVILARWDDDGEPTQLTSTGRAVWDLLEEPLSVERLVEVLSASYQAEPEVIERDVTALLQELEGRGFVFREPREEVGG